MEHRTIVVATSVMTAVGAIAGILALGRDWPLGLRLSLVAVVFLALTAIVLYAIVRLTPEPPGPAATPHRFIVGDANGSTFEDITAYADDFITGSANDSFFRRVFFGRR